MNSIGTLGHCVPIYVRQVPIKRKKRGKGFLNFVTPFLGYSPAGLVTLAALTYADRVIIPNFSRFTKPAKKPRSNVRALLIGIEYVRLERMGKLERLPGCHSDVNATKNMLVKMGVPSTSITTLKDDGTGPEPTSLNIRKELDSIKSLATKKEISTIWLFYSGHGAQTRDNDGDESDGQDEIILPSDFDNAGPIVDDYFKSFLKSLPSNVVVNAIFDCCHSATIMDLRYHYKPGSQGVEVESTGDIAANVCLISGCPDNTVSYSVPSGKNGWRGMLSMTLEKIMGSSGYSLSCRSLLDGLSDVMMNYPGQSPQLSLSRQSDLNDVRFPLSG